MPGPPSLEVHGQQQHGTDALTRLDAEAQTTTERESVRRLAKGIEEETGQDVHAAARARAARRPRGIASEASAGGAEESQPHVDTERNLHAGPDVYRHSVTQDHIAAKLRGHARNESLCGRVPRISRDGHSNRKAEDAMPHARRARQSATV